MHSQKPHGESLKKEQRLKSTSEFRRVFNFGKKFRGVVINAYVAPNSLPINRLGIKVTARYFRSASTRNRIKRLIREAFRKNHEILKTGFDFVVEKNKKDPSAGSYEEYAQDMVSLGQNLNILFKQ